MNMFFKTQFSRVKYQITNTTRFQKVLNELKLPCKAGYYFIISMALNSNQNKSKLLHHHSNHFYLELVMSEVAIITAVIVAVQHQVQTESLLEEEADMVMAALATSITRAAVHVSDWSFRLTKLL